MTRRVLAGHRQHADGRLGEEEPALARDEDGEATASRITTRRWLALIGLGISISISMDELAIRFSIGLIRLPVTIVIAAIAPQALIAAQLGLATGAKIAERWAERTEQIADIALMLLGAYLIAEQFTR